MSQKGGNKGSSLVLVHFFIANVAKQDLTLITDYSDYFQGVITTPVFLNTDNIITKKTVSVAVVNPSFLNI